MRVVFMGTPEFAVPSLRAIVALHDVVAVYTRPDSVSGRGGKTRPSAVKTASFELGLEVIALPTLRDSDAISELCSFEPDLIVVAAYGLILPVAALEAARLGAVNVHASLLPRWRGAAPIQRAILAGDLRAGVSIMRMEEGLDTGPYCLQLGTEIGEAGTIELTQRLADLGAQALVQALPAIADGTARWTVQEESLITYADKITKADVAISPDMTRAEALRRVRASSPAAPSRILIGSHGATMLGAAPAELEVAAGAIALTKNSLFLGAADGAIEATRVKPNGKGTMEARAWARGLHDLEGATWGGAL